MLATLALTACAAPADSHDVASTAPPGHAPPGMVWVPGGQFEMGDEGPRATPAEGPVHSVRVDGFFMEVHTVKNAEFRAFVKATGTVTVAVISHEAKGMIAQ